jgi:hypothetical protein
VREGERARGGDEGDGGGEGLKLVVRAFTHVLYIPYKHNPSDVT